MVVSMVVVGFRGFRGFRGLGHTRFPRESVKELGLGGGVCRLEGTWGDERA
jgi:hypothetical protein